MVEFLRKLFWVLGSGFLTLVGLAAGVFMIGFGFCATQGDFTLASASSWGVVFLILSVIAGLTWGFFKLARYCARQIPAGDDTDKADSP